MRETVGDEANDAQANDAQANDAQANDAQAADAEEQSAQDAAVMARAIRIGRTETVAQAWAARAGGPPRGMDISLWMRAQVARELAAEDAAREPMRPAEPRRAGDRPARTSTVFSLRLGAEEYAALTERSDRAGIGPSVLARTFIRTGLYGRHDSEWHAAIDRLDEVVAELHSLIR